MASLMNEKANYEQRRRTKEGMLENIDCTVMGHNVSYLLYRMNNF
jgi:hypothetical protein